MAAFFRTSNIPPAPPAMRRIAEQQSSSGDSTGTPPENPRAAPHTSHVSFRSPRNAARSPGSADNPAATRTPDRFDKVATPADSRSPPTTRLPQPDGNSSGRRISWCFDRSRSLLARLFHLLAEFLSEGFVRIRKPKNRQNSHDDGKDQADDPCNHPSGSFA